MTNSDLKSALSTFMERIWNNGDFHQIGDLVSPKYEIKSDPGDPWERQVLDLALFQERVMYSRNAFPDLRFDIQEMVAEDQRVVAMWIMSGTHLGDLPQLPATGKPFSISGMTTYYFQAGRVCGHWQAFDRLGFLMQMGGLGG